MGIILTNKIASTNLKKAIITKLKEISGYQIFDHLPAEVKYPYIVVAQTQEDTYGNKLQRGSKVTVFIEVYTQTRNSLQATQIGDSITQKLNEGITIEGFEISLAEFDQANLDSYDNNIYVHTISFTYSLLETENAT